MSNIRTVEINDRYRWTHPLKRELKRGLCALWNTDIHFKPFDGQDTKHVKYFRKKPKKGEYRDETLWKVAEAEKSQDAQFPIKPVSYTLNPMNLHGSNQLCSALQHRYLTNPSPTMDTRMKRYFRALCILEYEHDHGLLTENEFGPSMIGESCWTPTEKKRFFLALERCGKGNIEEIARRVGSTKTIAQVYEFQQTLESASKGIGHTPTDHLSAREMTPIYIAQEDHMASLIQETLEVESYAKSLNLMERPENELLEMWNMSSLTRVFGKTNDMTILSSSTINFYQLIKYFVSDIMVDLHTQLSNSKDKTVTKSLMNVTIAKRNKHILADRRVKNLDIMAMLDKRYRFHEPYTRGKSASYLAKRRRTMTIDDDEGLNDSIPDDEQESEVSKDEDSISDNDRERYIEVSDDEADIRWHGDESSDNLSDDEDGKEEDDDCMLKAINDGDAIPGIYVMKDEEREYEEALEANQSVEKTIGIESSDEETDNHDDAEEEAEMQRLDTLHEIQLMNYLEFYDEVAIINANESTKRRRTE